MIIKLISKNQTIYNNESYPKLKYLPYLHLAIKIASSNTTLLKLCMAKGPTFKCFGLCNL